ncbi:MAG: HD domain-containing protein [Patescibacteria group bacterium]
MMDFENKKEQELKPLDIKFFSTEEMVADFEKKGLKKYADGYREMIIIAEEIKKNGGRALLNGGSVRDFFTGKLIKDLDLEIYHLSFEKIKEIVEGLGFRCTLAGQSFCVLNVSGKSGILFDLSLPRTDSKAADDKVRGRGIIANTDPKMSITEAGKRRDFTINSMYADPLSGEIYDPYSGLHDLHQRTLRATDEKTFGDDPLRVLRGVQFVARFGLQIEPKTALLMRQVAPRMENLPASRFLEEWKKLLLKADKPSIGLVIAMGLGIMKYIHPDMVPMAITKQEKKHHPEGDAFIHTLMVVDEMAKIIRRENLLEIDGQKAFTLILAALNHDLGKVSKTTVDETGKINSFGHEAAGTEPTEKFLTRINIQPPQKDKITNLVREHMTPTVLYIAENYQGKKVSDKAIRDLAKRLFPATIEELVLVAEADHLGRGTEDNSDQENSLLEYGIYLPKAWLLERAKKCAVLDSKPADIIGGKDLLILDLKSGPNFGKIIRLANELRDELNFDKDQVLKLMAGENSAEKIIIKIEKKLKKTV